MRTGQYVTCFGVNGEVRLSVEDAVHHSSAVSVSGVVGVRGCHLRHIRSCGKRVGGIAST